MSLLSSGTTGATAEEGEPEGEGGREMERETAGVNGRKKGSTT